MDQAVDLRVLEMLAARLCHDLIGPVAAIGNGAELLADEEPDFVCAAPVFGMCVLGGNRWSELAAADRLEVRRPEALALADAMFLATPAPALLSFF